MEQQKHFGVSYVKVNKKYECFNEISAAFNMAGRLEVNNLAGSVLLNQNFKYGIVRPSVNALIEENERKIRESKEIKPLFPKAREAFTAGFEKIAGIKPDFTTSFSHTSPNISADKIFSMLLVDALRERGLYSVCMC
ncbi:MAG: hypothetical protein QXS91_01280 [Candidatus Anstonellales archaeon]